MNLIVIDDQTSVVNGIVKGVDWEAAGIDQVFKAYNAFEAKQIFKQHPVDIMLCDIEMPVENGIQFLRWVREQGFDTECIFLTAHAEFSYAREALALGSLDYIVSPAPYEEIGETVRRAVERVIERNRQQDACSYGQSMMDQRRILCQRMLVGWLKGSIDKDEYEAFSRIEDVPPLTCRAYPVVLRLIRQKISITDWKPSLTTFTIHNVASEIFAPFGQKVALADLDKSVFAMAIFEDHGYFMDYPGVLRQLETLRAAFEKYLKCEAAVYVCEADILQAIPEKLDKLLTAARENVSMACEVFDLSIPIEAGNINVNHLNLVMHRWESYIRGNLCDTARTEIFQMLDEMAHTGHLDQENLLRFHREFNQMVYRILEQERGGAAQLLNDSDALRLYAEASHSLDAMKAFVDYVLDCLKSDSYDEYEQRNQMEQIEKYIQEHLEADIHRHDIAEHIHLNVDYMGRLFKKNKGISLKEYIIEQKMYMARNLLKTTMLPVSFVASRVGYSNFSYFSRIYKKVIGVSPTDERKNQQK